MRPWDAGSAGPIPVKAVSIGGRAWRNIRSRSKPILVWRLGHAQAALFLSVLWRLLHLLHLFLAMADPSKARMRGFCLGFLLCIRSAGQLSQRRREGEIGNGRRRPSKVDRGNRFRSPVQPQVPCMCFPKSGGGAAAAAAAHQRRAYRALVVSSHRECNCSRPRCRNALPSQGCVSGHFGVRG